MIYTSYFAKLKSMPDNVIPISICGKAPDWYKGSQYKKLAPKYEFFMEWKKNSDNDYYIKHFNEEVLDHLNAGNVVDELYSLLPDKYQTIINMCNCIPSQNSSVNICLICYEKPSDFCHRHLVADWLNENGYPCEEYIF